MRQIKIAKIIRIEDIGDGIKTGGGFITTEPLLKTKNELS